MREETKTASFKRESSWSCPSPPIVEHVQQHVRILFNKQIIVESQNTKRVLETSHPPVYYIPMQDIKEGALQLAARRTWCEWKGGSQIF
jgi:uncharacterized protein (DUF427 family)